MSSERSNYVIVITTCQNDEQASRLAADLVERRLAACVQASDISSTYRWKGVIETGKEIRLLIKAKYADYAAIEAAIKAALSYENPEVLAIPVVAGSRLYLDWIDAETRTE
jgi:periplasmic divalent cation tolerance protein